MGGIIEAILMYSELAAKTQEKALCAIVDSSVQAPAQWSAVLKKEQHQEDIMEWTENNTGK